LKAQVAANAKGEAELKNMVEHFGLEVVRAYMGHVQDNAEEAVRRVIGALRDGECTYQLDNGAVIKVAVRVNRAARSAEIDFTGTSPQLPDNFNAPSSVAMAAVLYVLRTLVADDIPLNSGCLKPVTVIIPRGCMLAPEYPAAVAAGNVETSQRIVDVVLGALAQALPGRIPAASAGTMSNLMLGGTHPRSWAYYETIGGGAGAGPARAGASGIQTHMTNTWNTPVEALEHALPVRVAKYAYRERSGGGGARPGGEGVERSIELLAPATVTLIGERRRRPPYGLAGGGPGERGEDEIVRGGKTTRLPAKVTFEAEAGDVITVRTPGGGGYGKVKPL
jgi:5-oxoprolinase (ATP-hydrolysing)